MALQLGRGMEIHFRNGFHEPIQFLVSHYVFPAIPGTICIVVANSGFNNREVSLYLVAAAGNIFQYIFLEFEKHFYLFFEIWLNKHCRGLQSI